MLIPSYVEQSRDTDSYIVYGNKNGFQVPVSDGDLFFVFPNFHVRLKRVAPLEAVPGFSNGMTISFIINFR